MQAAPQAAAELLERGCDAPGARQSPSPSPGQPVRRGRSAVLCRARALLAHPGCNSPGAQPRGSEKKQITGQAPSILVKILSPAEPPRLPSLFQLAQRPGAPGAGLPLMKRKHCRAFKCQGRRVAPAGTASGPGSAARSAEVAQGPGH